MGTFSIKPNQPNPVANALTPQEYGVIEQGLAMYAQGWFPMSESFNARANRVKWVQPESRALIPLDHAFHIPKSLAQRVKSGRFIITTDTCFGTVIRACATSTRIDEEGDVAGTWLHPTIIRLFELFHKAGFAHSIEAWREREPSESTTADSKLASAHSVGNRTLVGGLYGLALGSAFCGESMFSRGERGGTDASKVCLVHLVKHLRARKFTMLDAQLANPHLARFGQFEIEQHEYLARLSTCVNEPHDWQPFVPNHTLA